MATVVQRYANSVVGGMVGQAMSLSALEHNLHKGELRELLVSALVESFLTSQFSIGSGQIVNQLGVQSRQNDVIIYDNRVLPPFIAQQDRGVYPAEAVIATIEVKTRLTLDKLRDAEDKAADLAQNIYTPRGSLYADFAEHGPICTAIAFTGSGARGLDDPVRGAQLLERETDRLVATCLVGKHSWAYMRNGWSLEMNSGVTGSYNETVRFIALLLDNMRSRSAIRQMVAGDHRDWMGLYLRDQGLPG